MLNKPKFMQPSTNMQECTIDAEADKIQFSCIVDGNEAISAWQIQIYTLNDGGIVLNTGKQPLQNLFFPVDNKNRNVVFDRNIKPYITTVYYPATPTYDADKTYYTRSGSEGSYTYSKYTYSSDKWKADYSSLFYAGEFKNIKSPYFWTISFWSATDIDNEFPTTTSCEEVFYANKTPEVSIAYRYSADDSYTELSNDIALTSRSCTFKAAYAQDEGVGLKRYGWRLIDTDSGQILTDTITSNQIYGTADNIVCSYNGFLNDGNYSVELYIETQNNTVLTTEPINFSILYNTTFLSNDFKVGALKNEPAIMLNWNESVVIGGRIEGEVEFKTNYPIIDYAAEESNTSVEIPVGSKIIYDYGSSSNLDIDENCYIALSTQLPNGNNIVLFDVEGVDDNGYSVMRKLSFNNGVFDYIVLGANETVASATYEVKNQPNQYVWYIIIMAPLLKNGGRYYTELTVIESKAINGLYPSTTLYPSTSLYPTFGTWDKLKEV